MNHLNLPLTRPLGWLCLSVMLAMPLTVEAAESPKKCPADPAKAAQVLWPMKEAFGRELRKLKGKHDCGLWLECDRRLRNPDWQCKWVDRDDR
ncbi:hypothetical protein [uncultured Cohaesibacter sp.]|uniref:hypothetical protein n=1 Tax=uncultured Cohaesibacter sp. TaxID=1002546 RepID=UPI0029C74827|nr:hypothetical protein [uncultured Cohaesibacter sp.]